MQRLVEPEARLDADDEQVEGVGERETDLLGAPLRQPRQDHARQDVAKAETAERHEHVGPRQDRRRTEGKQCEREQHADAEEDRDRLGAAVAGLHQPQAQRPHFLRRTGHLVADPLEHAHQRHAPRLCGCVHVAIRGELLEPAVDRNRAPRHQQQRAARDQRRAEHECEELEAARYTSILTICLIHRNPAGLHPEAPISIICPMRSRNSRFMCSGLMNASAIASTAGSASST